MENFKFEALVTEEDQLRKLEDCVKNIPHISDWKITKYLNGVLLSVDTAKMQAFEILRMLEQEGFPMERLYEE